MLNLKFQKYDKGIYNTSPSGVMSLKRFIANTIDPEESIKEAFNRIREAEQRGNTKLKDEIKQESLFFVTPSIKVRGTRSYEDIEEHLPLMVAEYDDILYPELMRDYVFEKFKSCIFAFCSPSKSGAKFIFRIPKVKSIKEYKEYYWGLSYYLDKFEGYDTSNQNCSLPLFCSWDFEAKYREDAEVWTERGFREDAFDFSREVSEIEPQPCSQDKKLALFNFITNSINSIADNAHPQVRSLSLVWGGFTSYYGLDKSATLNYLKELVKKNDYMRKNTRGYLKTVERFFNEGLGKPTEFKENGKI